MRGFAGIVVRPASPLRPEERLEAMLGDAGEAPRIAQGPIAVGACPTTRMVESGDGRVRLFLDGYARARGEDLLAEYESAGALALARRIEGECSACVLDDRTGVVHLVRDRLGVRPLFVLHRVSGFAFATSLRAIARSGLCLPKLDEVALWAMLSHDGVPGARTLLAGVERLSPGCVLSYEIESGALRGEIYWSLPFTVPSRTATLSGATATACELVVDAVAGRAPATGEIDCLWGPGLEGGLLAATAARQDRSVKVLAPTTSLDREHLFAAFDAVLDGADEPVPLDAAVSWTLLDDARSGRVVLDAAAAATVFFSAPHYLAAAHPARALTSAERVEEAARESALRAPYHAALGYLFALPEPGRPSAIARYPLAASDEFVWGLLGVDRRPPIETFREELAAIESRVLPPRHDGLACVQRAFYVDARLRLERKLRAVSDAARLRGVETRFPFADHRLVDAFGALPDPFKVDRREAGLLLKAVTRALAPSLSTDAAELWDRIHEQVSSALVLYAQNAFDRLGLVEEGIVSARGARAALVARAECGFATERSIWTILSVDRWWRAIRAEVEAALPVDGAIPKLARTAPATVDILIPVYESLNLVRDCIRSIQAFTEMPFRAFVLDDASCQATHERLCALTADDPRFKVLRNDENLGFVRTCQRGFAHCTGEYVVLLNSDTVVAPGWLERMIACAESDPRIAVVNPLSNEAANLSIRIAPGLNLTSMARRVAEISHRTYPDVTTAVGMCLLIRRSAMALLGGFDDVFAPAYCEESDLCMRFTEAGLRVVAADDAFIYHKGSASYGSEGKSKLYERNRAVFDRRWKPVYERDWAAYARRDPLQYVRDGLLVDTVALADGKADRFAALETRVDRLETSEILAATAVGARVRSAVALLPGRAPVRGRDEVLDANVRRRREPVTTFDARAVVFPTRRYVERLPAVDADKLRVTFLVSSLPLAGGVISILHVARELMLAGHDVKIATEAHEVAPEVLNLWTQPLVYRNREHLFEAFPESDVVVATFWLTAHRYMRELKRRYDFVDAYYIQDYEPMFYPDHEVEYRRDADRSYDIVRHQIYASQWIADQVGARGADLKTDVIPLDVDIDAFYPRGNRSETFRVVSVAAPELEKRRRGFPETVEAFRRIHEARPDVELVFFGADSGQMPELPFPYVNMGRIYDQNKVAELVSSAHVLVDASLWQGFGRPGLEAMACGTVPVLTGVGGLHEYGRNGENCVMTPPGDALAVAQAVLDLVNDRSLYERLSTNGPTMAERFSHRLIAARHLETYQRWVRDAREAGRMTTWRRGALD